MKKPKAFCCYLDNNDVVNMLSDEQAGRLWKQLYSFANYGELPDNSGDTGLAILFNLMSSQMKRDFEKYSKRIENASKGGAPKGNKNAEKNKKDD